MKIGMNFERDFPFLDLVKLHYFKNREVKCCNCSDFIDGKCVGGKVSKLEISECMIKKVISDVHESRRRGMQVYLDIEK